MKQAWYTEIYKIIEKNLRLNIPYEIIHFPSTGITSAVNRYAEWAKDDLEVETKIIAIDLRTGTFNDDLRHNRIEFFRVIRSYLEQYSDIPTDSNTEENIYQLCDKIITKYLKHKKHVIITFETSPVVILDKIPEYKEFLLYIERLRSKSDSRINLILTSTEPQFSEDNPSPVALLSIYFNYYRKEWVYKSINEDVLTEFNFKKHTPNDVIKIAELTGGLVVLVKSILRDIIIQDKKLSCIYETELDDNFFNIFSSTKIALERICKQLSPDTINCLINIANGYDFKSLPLDKQEYFIKTGIVDENYKLRGSITNLYFKQLKKVKDIINKYPDHLERSQVTSQINLGNDDLMEINHKLKINKHSGEIFINDIPNSEYLTQKELEIFIEIHNNLGKTVSREAIGKIIWGDNNDYSDWAIDKTISRIREKISDNKPYKIIKTSRGKGFLVSR